MTTTTTTILYPMIDNQNRCETASPIPFDAPSTSSTYLDFSMYSQEDVENFKDAIQNIDESQVFNSQEPMTYEYEYLSRPEITTYFSDEDRRSSFASFCANQVSESTLESFPSLPEFAHGNGSNPIEKNSKFHQVDRRSFTKYSTNKKDDLIEPEVHDVISGRAQGISHHPGNEYYRYLIRKYKVRYVSSTSTEKKKIIKDLVKIVENQSPPGRFLKIIPETGMYIQMSYNEAKKKIGQALREDAPKIRQMCAKQNKSNNLADDSANIDVEPIPIDFKRNSYSQKDLSSNSSTFPFSKRSAAARVFDNQHAKKLKQSDEQIQDGAFDLEPVSVLDL